jgi:hypothetical protein
MRLVTPHLSRGATSSPKGRGGKYILMPKIIHKILNIAINGLIVLALISYQFVLPVSLVRAEEEIVVTPEETEVTDNIGSGTEETVSGDNETEEVEGEEGESNGSEGEEGDATDETDTTDEADTTDTTETTDIADGTDTANEAGALLSETLSADSTTENENVDCACEDNESYEYSEGDCDNDYPDSCQCFIDYCDGLVSKNIAEDSSNAAVADSVTGENVIEGDNGVEGEEEGEEGESNGSEGGNGIEEEEEKNESNTTDMTDKTDGTDATINSGDATAKVAAVNAINTNIYTENGVEIVENITGDYAGDINLLEAFDNLLEGAQILNEQNEQVLESLVITNINIAQDVENSAVANADSGNNTIKNVDGSASITAGNAMAIAGAVNLINTNIVGDNWLFAVINVVGNWTGDLIVPGEGLLKTPMASLIFDKIVNVNIAKNIRNFLIAGANTGNNSIESAVKSANIQTGNAVSSASGANFVNTNITSNNWFFLMINNAGSWTGRVINWDRDTGEQSNIYEYEFGRLDDGCGTPECAKSVSVYNYNYAENVENTVMANANSGNNLISSAKDASIFSGNAGAWASAMNFVNTNIVGNNWMFAAVNNSGNWSGDVVFGYPDLSVTLTPDKNQIQPGNNLTYTVTYENIGQAKCDGADLMLAFSPYLEYQSGVEGKESGNNYYWSAEGLKPGEEKSFQVSVKLADDVPQDVTELESAVGIKTETAEKEFSNNSDSATVGIVFPPGKNLPSEVIITDDEAYEAMKETDIGIERSDDAVVAMGNIANHYIIVKNTGKRTLYNILVTEKIKDPSGQTAAEYPWVIAELEKGQSATIQYQLFMGPEAQLGTYQHSAVAMGYNEFGYGVESKKAKGETNLVAGYVSGVSQEIIPPEELLTEEFPQAVLGVEVAKSSVPWGWLYLLLLAPLAYFIKKKELYRWQTLQRLASRAAGFLSSFLS